MSREATLPIDDELAAAITEHTKAVQAVLPEARATGYDVQPLKVRAGLEARE